MSEAKHTAGPWEIIDTYVINTGDCIFGLQVWGEQRICLTERQNVGPDEERANAHLIAAAPEMLAALKAIQPEARREHDAGDRHFSTAEIEAVEAAIAKAGGGV